MVIFYCSIQIQFIYILLYFFNFLSISIFSNYGALCSITYRMLNLSQSLHSLLKPHLVLLQESPYQHLPRIPQDLALVLHLLKDFQQQYASLVYQSSHSPQLKVCLFTCLYYQCFCKEMAPALFWASSCFHAVPMYVYANITKFM